MASEALHEGNKIGGHSQLVWKDYMPVEVTQLAEFLNGAFVMVWHRVGLLVNTATGALHEKTSSACTFYVLCGISCIWVSSWDKGEEEMKVQGPHELSLPFISSVSFSVTIFPAFER